MSQLSQFAEKANQEGVINLAIGDLNFSCPKEVAEAKKRAIDEGKTHYTPVVGLEKLRKLAAEDFRKSGLSLSTTENTIIGAGAKPLLSAAIRALLIGSLKKEAIIPAPYYSPYEKMVLNAGGGIGFIDTLSDNFHLTTQTLKKNISSNTKIIIINSPNNPTGMVWFLKNLNSLPKDIWFIFDEAYYHFKYGTFVRRSEAVDVQERAVIIRSFSKRFAMSGFRLGYLTGPYKLVCKIKEILGDEFGCACSDSQECGIAALENCNGFSDKIGKELSRRRNYLCRWLKSQAISYPDSHGAFYVFANFSRWGNSLEVASKLLKMARVSVIPGTAFGNYDGWIRISYAGANIEELKTALKRIEEKLICF